MLFVQFDDRDDVLFLFKHVKKKRSQGVMQPTDRNWRILGHRLLQKKKKKKSSLQSGTQHYCKQSTSGLLFKLKHKPSQPFLREKETDVVCFVVTGPGSV